MMRSIILISLLVVLVSAYTQGGTWRNQLGSTLEITASDPRFGGFTGYYNTAVGNASGGYPIVGNYFVASEGTVIAWQVVWRNNHVTTPSITTWNGQLNGGWENKSNTIETTWLLVTAKSEPDQWSNTRTGHDSFVRIQ